MWKTRESAVSPAAHASSARACVDDYSSIQSEDTLPNHVILCSLMPKSPSK